MPADADMLARLAAVERERDELQAQLAEARAHFSAIHEVDLARASAAEARLEAVKTLQRIYERTADVDPTGEFHNRAIDLAAALSVAPQPDPIGKPCAIAPAVGGLVYDRNDVRCWHEGGLWHDLSVAPQPRPEADRAG